MEEEVEGITDHVDGFTVTFGFAFKSSQVMTDEAIFPFDGVHLCFGDDMLIPRDKLRINLPTVGVIELDPRAHDLLQEGAPGIRSSATDGTTQHFLTNPSNSTPDPYLFFLSPT